MNSTRNLPLLFAVLLVFGVDSSFAEATIQRSPEARALIATAVGMNEAAKAPALIARIKASGDPVAPLCEGIVRHNLGISDPQQVIAAVPLLEAYAKRIDDPLALGYWGSALTLRAASFSKKGDLLSASSLLVQGTKLVDQALAREPANPTLLFLRVENSLGVSESSPMKRWELVKTDLASLAALIAAKPADFAAIDQAHFDFLAGRLARDTGKLNSALTSFEKAIRDDPTSTYAAAARVELAKLEE